MPPARRLQNGTDFGIAWIRVVMVIMPVFIAEYEPPICWTGYQARALIIDNDGPSLNRLNRVVALDRKASALSRAAFCLNG